ncbi:hypothetical protein Gotur_023695 [Gossypium turneri]
MFQFVIDKVQRKLYGFDAKLLPMAGRTILFEDTGTLDYLIPNKASIPTNDEVGFVMVVDFMDKDGCWKWSELNNYFRRDTLKFIVACYPPNDALGDDISCGSQIIMYYNGWKEVWKNPLPLRIKHFLWLVRHKWILTNCERVRRKMPEEVGCLIYGKVQETDLHALHVCQFSAEAWMKVSFAVLCWMLSNNRNNHAFQQGIGRVEDTVRVAECFNINVYKGYWKRKNTRDVRVEMIKWHPPNLGWIKVNSDGATNRVGDWSMVGGWAILDGLELAQIRGHNKVIIETDCTLAVEIVKDCLGSMPSMTLIKIIKDASPQFVFVKFHFVNREGNTLSDWLAKTCPSTEVNLRILDVPTFHVRKLLLEDKFGDPYVRIN